jgi:hypothetical protein
MIYPVDKNETKIFPYKLRNNQPLVLFICAYTATK